MLAQERKKKIVEQLGIQGQEFENLKIDPVELLRAQGDLLAHNKKEKAEKAIAEKMAKECTFAPDTKKPKYKPFKASIN
jgi:NaMN:DMB phosphoribosyltransferase